MVEAAQKGTSHTSLESVGEQKVGDEHAPHKQGNSLHRQCRPAHEKDGGENVDRAGKAAEPRQMEAGVEWGDRADKTLLLSLVEKALRNTNGDHPLVADAIKSAPTH